MTLELKAGRTYRGKTPRNSRGLVNDRTIVWIGALGALVQYDGPAVGIGRIRPSVKAADFLKWADRDVTDELPEGEYARWPIQPAKEKS